MGEMRNSIQNFGPKSRRENRFISSEVKLLNRNRPLPYTLDDDDDELKRRLISGNACYHLV
jgi:hypothetical protein